MAKLEGVLDKKLQRNQLPLTIDFGADYRTLEGELKRLREVSGIGFEVRLEWKPGAKKYLNGRELAEEVDGDCIFIYAEDLECALALLKHGFLELLVNQLTKPYRQFINSLITLFEDQQYQRKEQLLDALFKLLER